MSCERENLNENLVKLIQYSKVLILKLFRITTVWAPQIQPKVWFKHNQMGTH